jgi:hypothetical protein
VDREKFLLTQNCGVMTEGSHNGKDIAVILGAARGGARETAAVRVCVRVGRRRKKAGPL